MTEPDGSPRRRSRWIVWAPILLVVAGLAWALWAWSSLKRSGRPLRAGTVGIAGLGDAVTVRFDDLGVPHVDAHSATDLAAALGWLHANDRMTQMELARRLAAGRLAELVGEALVPNDVLMRELRLPDAARTQLAAAGPESRALLDAYARGVNAWLAQRGDDLPPGLSLLGMTPEPWRPEDSLGMVVLQAVGLSFLLDSELLRLDLLSAFDADTVADFAPGTEPLAISEALLERVREDPPREAATPTGTDERGGSNNFAVAAERSASGAPLVANDPHLELGLPAVWYQVRLRAPDYDAAGMTLPGLPLVVIGQGPHVAWSITNSGLDNNDLFFEDVEEGRYRRGSDWLPLETEAAEVRVRGGGTFAFDLLSTDVGPCSPNWLDGGHASLAWTAHEPQDALATLLGLARARTLDDVRDAIADYVAPAQNLVVGHVTEGLMRTVLGRHPDRGRGLGQVPAPAWDREYHWRGLRPQSEQPLELAPTEGLLATANDDPRPAGWSLPFPAELDVPHRGRRARERLAERDDWTPEALAELQTDATSLYAREIVAASLAACTDPPAGPSASARALLAGWDGEMGVDSAPAALYAFYEPALYDAIFEDESERAGGIDHGFGYHRRHRLARALRGDVAVDWIDDVATDEVETLGDVVERALTEAWTAGAEALADPARARYGDLHRWTPRHPLASIPIVGERIFGVGTFPAPGSSTCLNALAGVRTEDGHREVVFGPSMRWVADTGDPDRSRACLPGGQSGHPFDPHYADQLADFFAGRTHPVRWSESAIEAATVSRLTFEPR